MKQFEHFKPPEVDKRFHKLELRVNGEVVGFAKFNYSSKPFPFYRVWMIFVNSDFQSKGYGADFLREINAFLIEKHRAGLLVNAIDEGHPSRGMYDKYGWKIVEGKEDWMSFNLPEGVDGSQMHRAIVRIEKMDELLED